MQVISSGDSYDVISCCYCSGNGDDDGYPCPTCGGVGKIKIMKPYFKCNRCIFGEDDGKPCNGCKGAGHVGHNKLKKY